jgi:hypothetical protein
VPDTLLAGMLISFATAAAFVALATVLNRRHVHAAARPANVMFALWWYCIGLQQFISASRTAIWAIDLPLSLHVGLSFVGFAATAIGLAGLLVYLIYVFTGRSVVLWPLVTFYALYFGYFVTLVAELEPTAVVAEAWSVSYAYAAEPSAAFVVSFLAVLLGPQLVAGVGLVVLALVIPPSAARVRVVAVAAGVLLWFGAIVLGAAADLSSTAWDLATRLIPLAVGVGLLLVYRPPSWLARRLPPELPSADAHGGTAAA